MATIKYKENGVVKELILPASAIKVLDVDGNFVDHNLEKVLKELGDADSVYLGDIDPNKEGIWFDTADLLNNNDDNNVVQRIKDYINDETLPVTSTSTTSELNALNVDLQKQIKFDVEGKTVYNVLGYEGDCEEVGKWLGWQTTIAVDSVNKVFGSNGLKLTLTGTNGSFYKTKANLGLDSTGTKYYLYSAYLKNGNATNINLAFGGQVVSVTDTTKFTRVGILINPTQVSSVTEIDVTLSGTSGQYGYVDGIMLNEIAPEEYALGVNAMLDKYPYVSMESSVGDNSTFIRTRGKNILNLVQGSIYSNGQFIYSTVRLTHKDGLMLAKPNTTYIFSSDKSVSYVWHEFDINKNMIDGNAWQTASTTSIYTTGANTKYLAIAFKIDDVTPIYAEDYKIQIEEGNVATTYECYQESLYEINQTLRSIDDTWKDEIKDGKLIRRVGKVVLDGTLPWTYGNTYTGYKYVLLPANYLPPNIYYSPDVNNQNENHKVLNTRNKLLINKISFSTYGSQYECFNISNAGLALTINSTDSGWGDSYTPTQAEIQAYFYGWKMYDSTANPGGGGVWNGTGTKSWCYIGSNGQYAGGVSVLPTTHSTAYYNPYRMYYPLLTPQIEELTPSHLVVNKDWSMVIECPNGVQSWVRPKVTYKIFDTQKTNINELEKGLSHSRKKISSLIKDTKNISNPNLLINPAFQIYQRGSSFTSSTSGQYTVDRWMIGSDTGATLTKSSKGVKINVVNVGTWTNFQQVFEDNSAQAFIGKTLTFSCKVSNPNNVSQTWSCGMTANGIPYYFAGGIQNIDYANNIISTTFKVDKFVTKFQIGIQLKSNVAGVETEIEWAKLEMSDRPTAFIAPSIAEEMTKCRRFYRKTPRMYSVGSGTGLAYIDAFSNLDMRIQPTTNVYDLVGNINKMSVMSSSYTITTDNQSILGVYLDKGMTRVHFTIPTNYNGCLYTVIEDSEIY